MTFDQPRIWSNNTTSVIQCADCGVITNPGFRADNRLLCRRCADKTYEPLTKPCPHCAGSGRVKP